MEDYFINPQEGGRAKSRSKTTNTRLTPYQRHLKEFAKTYKGKSLMKAAGAAWTKKQGGKSTSKKTSRKTSRRRSRSSRKQRGGADHDDDTTAEPLNNTNTGYGRDDTAALKQILMQRLYGS